jgi:hypothetical protein
MRFALGHFCKEFLGSFYSRNYEKSKRQGRRVEKPYSRISGRTGIIAALIALNLLFLTAD